MRSRSAAFDAKGIAVANAGQATWTLENLKGTVTSGKFTADSGAAAQAGLVKAAVGAVTGAARIRVIPDLPWTFDFEDGRDAPPPQWANATNKFAVRDLEGSKVLVKLAENPFAFAKRCRPFFGSTDLSNYTIEADVRAMERRRQMGDIGIVAQRYELVLFGDHQRLELQPWQPETQRTARVEFAWKKDTWYTMKLEVQSIGGKVESARAARCGRRDSPSRRRGRSNASIRSAIARAARACTPMRRRKRGGGSEMYYDNIKVYRNRPAGGSAGR